MAGGFDWRTEDDEGRSEAIAADGESGGGRAFGRLMAAAAAVVFLAIIGLFGYREITTRTSEGTSLAEDALRSTHDLFLSSVARGDEELLQTIALDRPPGRAKQLAELASANSLVDRNAFGLEWLSRQVIEEPELELSPDLKNAQVTSRLRFAVEVGRGVTATVLFDQSFRYQIEGDSWRLGSIDPDYWGETQEQRGRFLSLRVPERDSLIGQRLASDLESALAAACSSLKEIACGPDWTVFVTLSTEADALAIVSPMEAAPANHRNIRLPTPTLFGLPTNEAAYEAMFRGYATHVVETLIAEQAGWSCCQQTDLFRALTVAQMAQLGLRPWPVHERWFRLGSRWPLTFNRLVSIWEENPTPREFGDENTWWLAHGFAEFLMEDRADVAPLALQRDLVTSPGPSAWLEALAERSGDSVAELEADWLLYVREKVVESQERELLKMPAENVILMCEGASSGDGRLVRYDPQSNRWSMEIEGRELVSMDGLPGNEGVVLTEQNLNYSPDWLKTSVWSVGNEILMDQGTVFYPSVYSGDPFGRLAVLEAQDVNDARHSYVLLDITSCSSGACQIEPIEGRTRWSSDGTKSLGEVGESIVLWRDPKQEGSVVGQGSQPFWFGDGNFGYLRSGDPTEVVLALDGESGSELVLGTADLAPALGNRANLDITWVAPGSESTILLILATNRDDGTGYVLGYDWVTANVSLRLEIASLSAEGATGALSPDGRWLVLYERPTSGEPGGMRTMYLHDITRSRTFARGVDDSTIRPISAWTSDGAWFVQLVEGGLILSQPVTGDQRLVLHDFKGCTSAEWVKAKPGAEVEHSDE